MRAGLITQHTIDAHGVLLEFRQFGWGLRVCGQRRLRHISKLSRGFVLDDIGFNRVEFFDKRFDVHNEIFFNRKVIQWLDRDFVAVGKIAYKG